MKVRVLLPLSLVVVIGLAGCVSPPRTAAATPSSASLAAS